MALDKKIVRESLIAAGVKNLKEFGYPSVDEKNIFTDTVYVLMFQSMLRDNLSRSTPIIDEVINDLLKEIGTKGY